MAVVSARINEKTKSEAEEIAEAIGLSLSTVINIFLNRFVSERGFPFEVVAPRKENAAVDRAELEKRFSDALKDNVPTPKLPLSAYIDPNDNIMKYTEKKG